MSNQDEEDDYMSNDFLNQIADTRPGLVWNRTTQRKYDLEKKHAEESERHKKSQMPVRELEAAKRNEALKTSSMSTSNKGFALMLKMGYKSGEALGKSNEDDDDNDAGPSSTKRAHIEPIPIVLKTDRIGLGDASEKERRLEEVARMRARIHENTQESYLSMKRSNFQLRKLIHNLHKCQRICFQLDSTQHNLSQPEVKWYWPKNIMKSIKKMPKKEKDERIITEPEPVVVGDKKSNEEKDVELEEQKNREENAISRLASDNRKVDLSKVYQDRLDAFLGRELAPNEMTSRISAENNDEENEEDEEEDELDLCSRRNKLKRREEEDRNENELEALSEREDNDDEEEEDDVDDEGNEEVVTTRIEEICAYLRKKYIYCVWCALTYDNEVDLSANCPGPSERDHENE